jgi:fermentation-respiration switch protein FrsA (DUF1100 family)
VVVAGGAEVALDGGAWIETHNHVELYDQDPYVPEAAGHAIRWLNEHVGA